MKISATYFCLLTLVSATSTLALPALGRRLGKKGGKKDSSTDAGSKTSKSGKKKGDDENCLEGHVLIANRGSGSFSIVNPDTLEVKNQPLQGSGEPMYFAFASSKSEIWVGDRANNRLEIYKVMGCDLKYDGYVSTPAGLFHSLFTQDTSVEYPIAATTCDIDNVVVLHDLTTRRTLATLERPQEAIDSGSKPHDTTVTKDYIAVTFLHPAKVEGYVATYSANYPYEHLATLVTEVDPHVAARDDSSLFIAAQGAADPGKFVMVSLPDLSVMKEMDRPSPHGMFLSYSGEWLYTTNIRAGGAMAVDVWNAETGELQTDCDEIILDFPVPHNPALSLHADRLFVTHSGAESTMNAAIMVNPETGCLYADSVEYFETGLNPFGIAVWSTGFVR